MNHTLSLVVPPLSSPHPLENVATEDGETILVRNLVTDPRN